MRSATPMHRRQFMMQSDSFTQAHVGHKVKHMSDTKSKLPLCSALDYALLSEP
jgi:hypothetical protein